MRGSTKGLFVVGLAAAATLFASHCGNQTKSGKLASPPGMRVRTNTGTMAATGNSTSTATYGPNAGPDCPAIAAAIAADKARLVPPVDLSCKLDTDCTVGAPHTQKGFGDVMNETSFEARAAGQQALGADPDYIKQQASYASEQCAGPTFSGVMVPPPETRAICVSDKCTGFSVPSSTYVGYSCASLNSELQALEGVLTPAEQATDQDVQTLKADIASQSCPPETGTPTGTATSP